MLPLRGIRILTFENFGAGPFGSMYLADLGAEVIKIENREQGGDATRNMGPHFLGPNDSHFFQTFNLNKKSVTLNLKHAQGQVLFHKLVATADAVMNNLRGDQPEKLGLTYSALQKANPRIVCAHLSAYGRDNARTAWPGYDYLMQAEAGFFHLTGEPGSPPARMGLSIIDYMTGITTSLALLAALIGVGKTGKGRDIDVSLFDVALHQLSYPGTWFLNEKQITGRMPRSAHPSAVPVQTFKTADGWIFIMCMLDKFWSAMLQVMKREDLGKDARFVDMAARRANREVLTTELDAIFSTATTAQWLLQLQGVLPVAPVYDLAQALENPYLNDIQMLRNTPHPLRADFRSFVNPIKLDGDRLPSQVCSALGADNAQTFGALGVSDEELAALSRDKVI